MKFIICPFCKHRIMFSSFVHLKRSGGHVKMSCPGCRHHLGFTIQEKAENQEESFSAEKKRIVDLSPLFRLQVIENLFAYAADFSLCEGLNRIGRYNDKYSELEVPIRTSDPSMDRTHSLIIVEKDVQENYQAVIMDNDSMTGTFINNRELSANEKYVLQDGDVITLGATSIIFQRI